MIKVNKDAKKNAIEKAYKEALQQAQSAAERGQSSVVLNYWCPGYSEGYAVLTKMEKQGVKCNNRGFGNTKQHDGSYKFNVSCSISD